MNSRVDDVVAKFGENRRSKSSRNVIRFADKKPAALDSSNPPPPFCPTGAILDRAKICWTLSSLASVPNFVRIGCCLPKLFPKDWFIGPSKWLWPAPVRRPLRIYGMHAIFTSLTSSVMPCGSLSAAADSLAHISYNFRDTLTKHLEISVFTHSSLMPWLGLISVPWNLEIKGYILLRRVRVYLHCNTSSSGKSDIR